MESNNKEEEKQQLVNTIKTTQQKIKELEESLDGIKFSFDEKQELTEIYENGEAKEEQNKKIN